jgi:hypothetical protein
VANAVTGVIELAQAGEELVLLRVVERDASEVGDWLAGFGDLFDRCTK